MFQPCGFYCGLGGSPVDGAATVSQGVEFRIAPEGPRLPIRSTSLGLQVYK